MRRVVNKHVTAERVREMLNYDGDTGAFTWVKSPSENVEVGSRAGTVLAAKGYRQIAIDGRRCVAHRLAWLYVYGEWPSGMLDHINGNRDDNAIRNLRIVSPSHNLINARWAPSNSVQARGVYKHKNRYRAVGSVGGKKIYLGSFTSLAEAERARIEWELCRFGETACRTSGRPTYAA